MSFGYWSFWNRKINFVEDRQRVWSSKSISASYVGTVRWMSKGSYFVGNRYSVREQMTGICVKGRWPLLLVDEASMISRTLLSAMESTLSSATHAAGQVFGGIAIVFFGDFGQLGPVISQSLAEES